MQVTWRLPTVLLKTLFPRAIPISKGSLIVNLSGCGGIALERGLGLIRESLDIVRLGEEDIVKILAASTLLMAAITRQPIDWSQRQPR